MSIGGGVRGARKLGGDGDEGSVGSAGGVGDVVIGVGVVKSKADGERSLPEVGGGSGGVLGEGDGEGGLQEREDSCSSSSTPSLVNSSTSHHRFAAFLVRLEGWRRG